MKKNLTIFAFIFVVATLFTACNWAPEGKSWDYKNVKDLSYNEPSYEISPGTKYRGIAYCTKTGGGGEWRFKNNTDSTITCKYAQKFTLKGTATIEYIYESENSLKYGSTIENPEAGFEVPAGASIRLMVGTSYRIQSGGDRTDFFKFYLSCN